MTEPIALKTCKTCRIPKEVSEYYLQFKTKLFNECKECTKIKRRGGAKKLLGFDRLSPETVAGVTLALQDRRNKITNVAEDWAIEYHNLSKWVREGRFSSLPIKE